MSEAFLGQIKMFAGNFAPRGWTFCDGQLLAIAQNSALFSLLGTVYGGDGRITFGLPDLRGRIPIHAGSGAAPGLTGRQLGAKSGSEDATVTLPQLNQHSHTLQGTGSVANSGNPQNNVVGESSLFDFYQAGAPTTAMDASSITSVGGGQSHVNVAPFLCINYIISLAGTFPSRD